MAAMNAPDGFSRGGSVPGWGKKGNKGGKNGVPGAKKTGREALSEPGRR